MKNLILVVLVLISFNSCKQEETWKENPSDLSIDSTDVNPNDLIGGIYINDSFFESLNLKKICRSCNSSKQY